MGHISCQIMGCVYCASLLAGKLNAPPHSVIRPVRQRSQPVRSGFVAMLAFIRQSKPTPPDRENRESKRCASGAQEPQNRRIHLVTQPAHGGAWVCVWALG